MRVKLKSGEIVDVVKVGNYYIDNDNNPYREEEVEVLPSEDELKEIGWKEFSDWMRRTAKEGHRERERIYWRDVRKEILIELIKLKYLFHDLSKEDLVDEADTFVKLLKEKDK